MKKKLSINEQIEHMKSQGIGFDLISEVDAADYLENNNYYFKIKAYAKNYAKYQLGDRKGQYVNLEFAYLKDLATIDMHLRHFILKTSTDIEHALKVRLIKDFNASPDNGYEYVAVFLDNYPDVMETIRKKQHNSYTGDLISKLLEEGFAIWNIVELLSLKDFLMLYRGFYETYPDALTGINYYYPMQGVRKLRNAAAHNNCLINSLRKPYSGKIKYNSKVNRWISDVKDVSAGSRRSNKSNQVIYDFITMLYLVDELIPSPQMKLRIYDEAYDLFHVRMQRNADYYKKEVSITSAYIFVCKLIDFHREVAYNNCVI